MVKITLTFYVNLILNEVLKLQNKGIWLSVNRELELGKRLEDIHPEYKVQWDFKFKSEKALELHKKFHETGMY